MEIGRRMKQLVVALVLSLILCAAAYAQMGGGMTGGQGEKNQPGMMMDAGMMSMMNQMMGQGMMMKDMMQMMMDMMDMQERSMMRVRPAEKKQMMMDMARMREKMKSMMSMMMGQSPDGSMRMKCSEQWLKKAIDLHEVHLKDPKTATEESQMEMMHQMKEAYECLTAATVDQGKTNDEKPKDPHGH